MISWLPAKDSLNPGALSGRMEIGRWLLALLLALPGLAGAAMGAEATAESAMHVYFGTYTGDASKGIYVSHFDAASGQLSAPQLAAEVVSPAFLALHPNRGFLYAVNEIGSFKDLPGGAVSAFAIEPGTGRLRLLNQESTRGGGPCHLTVDPSGSAVLVANYGGGSIAVLPVRPNGDLGPTQVFVQHSGSSVNSQRQLAPHAHGIYVDASNRFVFVPDLGIDKVLVYRWDSTALALQPHESPATRLAPGAGPRHFAFHPGGRFAYVINELLNTITAFAYAPTSGLLQEIQTLTTLPEHFEGQNSTAEIVVHPSGRFLYGSNRGHDSLAMYAIDPSTGRLVLLGHEPTQGRTPRNFAIDPTGTWLLAANQGSGNVVVFRVNRETGKLQSVGHAVAVPTPVCVLFR
jgi:6-phosphogluconolactonase